MEPWGKKRKSRDFFFEFENMDEMMNDLMKRFFSEEGDFQAKKRPVMFGFSMKMDSEGKPIIKRFGNVQSREGRPIVANKIEPLVDVIEEEKEVILTAELPGVKKEEIDLRAEGKNKIVLEVKNMQRPYYKEILLQHEIREGSAKASFKNGILEAHFKKLHKEKKEKGKIKIE